jgi:hypothetical protein
MEETSCLAKKQQYQPSTSAPLYRDVETDSQYVARKFNLMQLLRKAILAWQDLD